MIIRSTWSTREGSAGNCEISKFRLCCVPDSSALAEFHSDTSIGVKLPFYPWRSNISIVSNFVHQPRLIIREWSKLTDRWSDQRFASCTSNSATPAIWCRALNIDYLLAINIYLNVSCDCSLYCHYIDTHHSVLR